MSIAAPELELEADVDDQRPPHALIAPDPDCPTCSPDVTFHGRACASCREWFGTPG